MQLSIFSLVEHRVSHSQSLDYERAWLTLEATSLSPSLRSLQSMLPAGYFGKTCLACCHPDKDGTLVPSSEGWPNAGTGGHTGYLMPNTSEFLNAAVACSLSDILETGDVPRRFYLSATACRGILRRAAKRGKTLPAPLQAALEAVAGAQTLT
jgi:hypothetical protein